MLQKCSLLRIELPFFCQTFDGGDLIALMHDREGQARIDSPAVHMHRAGSTLPVVATFLRSEEPEIFSQRIQQRNAWLDLQMLYCVVDFQRNFHRAFGVLSFICDERFGGWRSSMK